MLSNKEELLVNLLLDKEMKRRTVIAVIHLMDTEDRQDRMIRYLQSKEEITKDEVMTMAKEIFLATE